METQVNTLNEVKTNFELGYDMLPAKYQVQVRNNIMGECGWRTIMTFHRKRKGMVEIRPLEIPVIEKHFHKHNIDPWTGQRIS